MHDAKTFFTDSEKENIVCAIRDAEQQTSGEIVVHLENQCPENLLDRAAHIFSTLELQKTAERNAVLFYLAVQDRCFAILGDVGINTKVDHCFWNDVRDLLQAHFKQEQFCQGLVSAIHLAGEKLREHFPFQGQSDINELDDAISFGD